MTATISNASVPFRELIVKAIKIGLVSSLEIERFLASQVPTGKTDRALAAALVDAQLLTPFQIDCLLRSRTRGLCVDRYKILFGICSGGMGEIYAARLHGSNDLFAVKSLRSELRKKPRSVLRFELEAFALSSLSSDNILRYVDSGWAGEKKRSFPYLVTELVQGPNLHELVVSRGGLPWQQACDIVCQIADGLTVAHSAGFIHRDVKPSNVVIARTGVAKLIDFGLALYQGSSHRFQALLQPTPRKSIGTPRFSAPEQFVDANFVGPQSDIFALGTTLLFALTGKTLPIDLPASPSDAAVSLVDAIRLDVPDAIRGTLHRMLARSAADRFECAQECVAELRQSSIRFPVESDFESLVRSRSNARKKVRQKFCSGVPSQSSATQYQPVDIKCASTTYDSDVVATATIQDTSTFHLNQPAEPSKLALRAEMKLLQEKLALANSQLADSELQQFARAHDLEQELTELKLQLRESLTRSQRLEVEGRHKDELLEIARSESRLLNQQLILETQKVHAQKESVTRLYQHSDEMRRELALCYSTRTELREALISIAARLLEAEMAKNSVEIQLADSQLLADLHSTEIRKLNGELGRAEFAIARKVDEVEALKRQLALLQAQSKLREAALQVTVERLQIKVAAKLAIETREANAKAREQQRINVWSDSLEAQMSETADLQVANIDAELLHALSIGGRETRTLAVPPAH